MIEGLALLGAWASLLGGLAAKVAHIKPAILPSLFVSLSVAFFYYSLVVRHWVAELSWSIIGTPEVHALRCLTASGARWTGLLLARGRLAVQGAGSGSDCSGFRQCPARPRLPT